MGITALWTSKGSVSGERVNTSSELMYQGLGQNICATCAGYDCILPMMGKKGKTVNAIQQVNILEFDLHCHYFKGNKSKTAR